MSNTDITLVYIYNTVPCDQHVWQFKHKLHCNPFSNLTSGMKFLDFPEDAFCLQGSCYLHLCQSHEGFSRPNNGCRKIPTLNQCLIDWGGGCCCQMLLSFGPSSKVKSEYASMINSSPCFPHVLWPYCLHPVYWVTNYTLYLGVNK